MPAVPGLAEREEGSIASQGQTSFGADRQLFADKPILSLVEQRVKQVAEETRTAGMLDWLPGFGAKPAPAKPTPEPVQKPVNYGAAAPMGNYPSDADAAFAKKVGMGYGTVHEPFMNEQTARLYGEVRMVNVGKGKSMPAFVADTAAGKTLAGLMTGIIEKGKAINVDLTKPEFTEARERLGQTYAKAAMAVEGNSIAKLGYDPKLVAADVSGQLTSVLGAYGAPKHGYKGEGIYANIADPSVLVHESMHRGLDQLVQRNPKAKELLDKIPEVEGTSGHEHLVRYLMVKHMGDPEKMTVLGNEDRQRKEAIAIFEDKRWAERHKETIDKLLDLAAEEVRRKRPGGPR